MAQRLFQIAVALSLLFTGAIFGFFYAFFASVLNGFDTMDGAAAIDAMNAINREVRNVRFFPIFFLTPLIMTTAAGLGWLAGNRRAALFLFAAAIVYVFGAMAPTVMVSVPLNQSLMIVDVPALSPAEAARVWEAYSTDWSRWNGIRALMAGTALAVCGAGIWFAASRIQSETG